MRASLGIEDPPRIQRPSIVDAERAIRLPIPAGLLAIHASTGASLGHVVELYEQLDAFAKAEGQREWRKLARFHHIPFDATYNEEGFLCVTDDGTTIVYWDLQKYETSEPSFLKTKEDRADPFVAYLRWKYPDVPVTTDVPPKVLSSFKPEVAVKKPKAAVRVVRHAKFGEGRIVREHPPDKLEIDFGAAGVKKLLASAVELVDTE